MRMRKPEKLDQVGKEVELKYLLGHYDDRIKYFAKDFYDFRDVYREGGVAVDEVIAEMVAIRSELPTIFASLVNDSRIKDKLAFLRRTVKFFNAWKGKQPLGPDIKHINLRAGALFDAALFFERELKDYIKYDLQWGWCWRFLHGLEHL